MAAKGAVSPENRRAALLTVTEKGQELAKAAPGVASQASHHPSQYTNPRHYTHLKDMHQDTRLTDVRHRRPAGSLPTPEPLRA